MNRFIVLILFLFSELTFARPYNYADVQLGEKSFGMGGASMALLGDVGQIYFNPAALADLSASQVSAALSGYARNDTRTGAFVNLFQSAVENISRGGFKAIPSMAGGNVRWGEWVWGGAILIPDSFANSGTTDIESVDSAAFEGSFQSLWLGAFLSRRWEKNAFGISFFYANRSFSERYFFISNAATNPVIRFLQRGQSINGLVAVLGGLRYLSSDLKLGYSLRLPPLAFPGSITVGDTTSGSLEGYDKPKEVSSRFFPLPIRIGLGLAWEPITRWSFAFDAYYFAPLKGNMDSADQREEFNFDAKQIVNISLGAEYFPWTQLGFRVGILSNMSAARTVPVGLSAISDKVNMFGGTGAIVFDKASGSISIGGYIQGGQGRAYAMDLTNSVVPRSNYSYGALIGSAFKF